MTWREAVTEVVPGAAPTIVESVADRWGGANLYLSVRVVRLRWRRCAPGGAAERFADDLRAAILHHGGTIDDARVVLAAIVGRRFVV